MYVKTLNQTEQEISMSHVHVSKLAAAINVSLPTLYRLKREGVIRVEYPYGRVPALVSRQEFDRMVREHLTSTFARIAGVVGEEGLAKYVEEAQKG